MMSATKVTLSVCGALLLGACATSYIEPIRRDVAKVDAETSSLIKQVGQRQNTNEQALPSIERVQGLWIPFRRIKSDDKAVLSAQMRRSIVINEQFMNIQEVAEKITNATGIPVVVSPDVTQQIPGQTGVGGGIGGVGMPFAGATALPPLPGATGATGQLGSQYGYATRYKISYDGNIAGLLDVIAARFGISAEESNDRIRFYRYTTKTFRIVSLPGDSTLSNTVSNTSGNSSGSGGTGGTTSTTSSSASSAQQAGVSFSNLSVWKGIEDSIKTMLSPAGKVVVTAATGTVTVTDTPQIVAQVDRFIEQQNASLGRQVVVNVRVLSVDLSRTDQYGINWDAVYNSLSGNFGWGFSNAFATDPSATNLTLKILGTAGSATSSSSNIKAWSGSQAMISALSLQGDVSQITSATVTTLNNQPAPVQVGRQTSYLASSTSTAAANVGTTTTITPGLVTTGFSMNLVPHLLDKGKLLLQYAIDISSLVRMGTVTSGTATIQTPEIDTRNFLQRVMLNSGDTLVMTGFEQNNLTATTQGMGSPDNVALGGGVNGKKQRSVLVILIQPVISDI